MQFYSWRALEKSDMDDPRDCKECNNPRSCHSELGCPKREHGAHEGYNTFHVAYAHARRYLESHPEAKFDYTAHLIKNV